MEKVVNKITSLSILLCGIILTGTITNIILLGPSGLVQQVEAGSMSESQYQAIRSQATAAIEEAYDALRAVGITGTPGALENAGNGFAQMYRNSDGTLAFAIFTKDGIAYSVVGPIMSTYKSEGWHLGDLGFPTSNEKDLVGIANGRYNEFEHGVIAMIKGKNAQAFPTVQAAVDKLKQVPATVTENQISPTQPQKPAENQISPTQPQEPSKAPSTANYRVSVTFDKIKVNNDRDKNVPGFSGAGEYRLAAYVQDLPLIDLTKLSQWKTPGKGGLNDVNGGSTLEFKPANKYTFETDSFTALTILTTGYEYDGCNSGFSGLLPTSIGNELDKNRKNASEAGGAAVGSVIGGPAGALVGKTVAPILDGIAKGLESKLVCKINPDDDIGSITAAYDPPTYGAGSHCEQSDTKYYELCFTVTAQKTG